MLLNNQSTFKFIDMANLKKIVFLSICSLSTTWGYSQLNITIEKIGDHFLPKAQILSADFMTGEITEWGSIDDQGFASFDLPYDFLETIMKEAEKQQKDAPKGWTMSFHTVGSKNECSKYSSQNSITIENPDAKIFGLPPFFAGDKATETRHGSMYAASNIELAKWVHSYQMDNAATGFYAEWIFVEKEATVKGTCSMLTMTGHESEEIEVSTTYDLNFEAGWNIVVYTIEEVFNSASERVFATKTTISTTKFFSEELLQWYVLED